ncbi:MAG TPA: DUF1513 domain-containing protein, partial [Nannocystis sp.]
LGGGARQSTADGSVQYYLAAMALDRPDPRPVTIPLTFLPHGVTPAPGRPDLVLLFEKHGPGACAVDLAARSVAAVLQAPPGRQFYGHGAFSRDSALLYCTETDLRDRKRGYIAVHDGRDFRYLGDFPTHGLAPHDCLLRDDGRTLVVTNGGSPVGAEHDGPCVTFVDVATGALLAREPIPDPRLNAGHLAMTRDGGLAVTSAPRDGVPPHDRGGVSLRGPTGPLRTCAEPADIVALMQGETLSLAIGGPRPVVATTSPLGHLVAFWSLATGELVRSLRVPSPRGVALTLDGREFVITFGATAKASRIDVETLAPVDAPGNRSGIPCAITGSHVLVHDTAAFA